MAARDALKELPPASRVLGASQSSIAVEYAQLSIMYTRWGGGEGNHDSQAQAVSQATLTLVTGGNNFKEEAWCDSGQGM